MKLNKHFLRNSIIFLVICFLLPIYSFAQNDVKIVRTIAYHVVNEFQDGDVQNTKMSADGTKIVYSDYATKIYTINTDGTDPKTIYDFQQRTDPWLDISANGSKVVLAPKYSGYCYGFIILNSDGGQQVTVDKLPKPDGTTTTLGIPFRPQITADGSTVYFCNTGGGEDMAGVWRINSDGTSPQQLISYTQIKNQLNLPYIPDWGHIFREQFDISDDGSRMIWTTDKIPANPWKQVLLAFDGTNIRILMEPLASPYMCAISGDGTKVAAVKNLGPGKYPLYVINFDGSNPLELASNYGGAQLQLTRDGSKVFAHWPGSQGTSHFLNTDGTNDGNLGIVQAQWLHWNIGNPFRALHFSNISADGKRISFATSTLTVDRLRRIWFAEINPPSLGTAPAISDVKMNPNWVLTEGRSKSTFSAKVSSGQGQIKEAGYASFPNGFYRNIFNSYHELRDDGTVGDVTSGDGLYTKNDVGTQLTEKTTGPIPIRFSAFTESHVTSVDVLPFFVLENAPSGASPTINSVNPTSTEPGSQITINGSGFNPIAGQNVVLIGNTQATVISATPTQLTVQIPQGLKPGTYPVTVSSNGQTSNAGSITISGGSSTLNPPRNLTATVSGTSVILNWEPPATTGSQLSKKHSSENTIFIQPKFERKFPTLTKNISVRPDNSILNFTGLNEIEPNNSPSQAQTLVGTSPITVNGSVQISDVGTIDLGDDIEDLFKITIKEKGLKIDLSGFNSDCDLFLLTEDGTQEINASMFIGATDPESIDEPELESGTYLIGVSIYDPEPLGPEQTNYTLTVTGNFGGGGPVPANLQAYNIYRSNSANAKDSGVKIGQVDKNTTTYTDAGLSQQTYYYQVTAVYDVGESGPSNEATATIGQPVDGIPIFPTAVNPQMAGNEFWLDIKVGTNEKQVTNLFGVSYVLNFTRSDIIDVVTPHSSNAIPGDFLGNDLVFVQMVDETAGTVSIGISRKTGQGGVNGNGTIVRIKFVTKPETPNGTQITFSFTELTANDPNGTAIVLTTQTFILTINSGLLVWPGDTNNDLIVNQADVLPLGLYWKKTGPARANASTNWIGQTATPWTNKNTTYADANGDGTINQADVLPIGLNWKKTHQTSAKLADAQSSPHKLSKILGSMLQSEINGETDPGQEFWVEIKAIDVNNLFGIAFELNYSPTTFLEPIISEPGSFIGDDVIFFPNIEKDSGRVSIGVTRKAGQGGVNGTGVVTRVKMKMSASAAIGDSTMLMLQHVSANDPSGRSISFDVVDVSLITNVENLNEDLIPTKYDLYQNYPNPFNPTTEIKFSIPEDNNFVSLFVYDIFGNEVKTLVREKQNPGFHTVTWNGTNNEGIKVASGVYFYRLQAGSFTKVNKMILMK